MSESLNMLVCCLSSTQKPHYLNIEEFLTLSCDGDACKSCVVNYNDEILCNKCHKAHNICENQEPYTIPSNKTIELFKSLFYSNKNQLISDLKDKASKVLKREKNVNFDKIKDEIETEIRLKMVQLENIKVKLLEQLEKYRDLQNNYTNSRLTVSEIDSKLSSECTPKTFFDIQNKLLDYENSNKTIGNVIFKSGEQSIDESFIGRIYAEDHIEMKDSRNNVQNGSTNESGISVNDDLTQSDSNKNENSAQNKINEINSLINDGLETQTQNISLLAVESEEAICSDSSIPLTQIEPQQQQQQQMSSQPDNDQVQDNYSSQQSQNFEIEAALINSDIPDPFNSQLIQESQHTTIEINNNEINIKNDVQENEIIRIIEKRIKVTSTRPSLESQTLVLSNSSGDDIFECTNSNSSHSLNGDDIKIIELPKRSGIRSRLRQKKPQTDFYGCNKRRRAYVDNNYDSNSLHSPVKKRTRQQQQQQKKDKLKDEDVNSAPESQRESLTKRLSNIENEIETEHIAKQLKNKLAHLNVSLKYFCENMLKTNYNKIHKMVKEPRAWNKINEETKMIYKIIYSWLKEEEERDKNKVCLDTPRTSSSQRYSESNESNISNETINTKSDNNYHKSSSAIKITRPEFDDIFTSNSNDAESTLSSKKKATSTSQDTIVKNVNDCVVDDKTTNFTTTVHVDEFIAVMTSTPTTAKSTSHNDDTTTSSTTNNSEYEMLNATRNMSTHFEITPISIKLPNKSNNCTSSLPNFSTISPKINTNFDDDDDDADG